MSDKLGGKAMSKKGSKNDEDAGVKDAVKGEEGGSDVLRVLKKS